MAENEGVQCDGKDVEVAKIRFPDEALPSKVRSAHTKRRRSAMEIDSRYLWGTIPGGGEYPLYAQKPIHSAVLLAIFRPIHYQVCSPVNSTFWQKKNLKGGAPEQNKIVGNCTTKKKCVPWPWACSSGLLPVAVSVWRSSSG